MYSDTEKNLAATYLFDQGEKDLNVYKELFWQDPELTMEKVTQKVWNYRQTKEYQDFYAKFAQTYDSILKRKPTDFQTKEQFSNDYSINKFFYIANERKISPEQILEDINIAELVNANHYQQNFGQKLMLLGEHAVLKPWERLIADTICFQYQKGYENAKNEVNISQSPGAADTAFQRTIVGQRLNVAREELNKVINNYRTAFDAFPPEHEAVSEIYGWNFNGKYELNENRVINAIEKYADNEMAISSIVEHIRKEIKDDESAQLATAHQFSGMITPGITTALITTAYFQSYIGKWFEHVSPSIFDKNIIALSDDYLLYIDKEIDRLEKEIAIQERHPEEYKDLLSKNKGQLPELRQISQIGHKVMAEINANFEIRAGYEEQAAKGLVAADDIRKISKDLNETPSFIDNSYFRNVYGYQLENLFGRELSQGDLYIINRYREFLATRIDTIEAKIQMVATGTEVNTNELRALWKKYAADSKLLEAVNNQLHSYKPQLSAQPVTEYIRLIYYPEKQIFAMNSAFDNPGLTYRTVDPFITREQAQAFINDFTKKINIQNKNEVSYQSVVSEMRCWQELNAWKNEDRKQFYLTMEINYNVGYTLPTNLRDNMTEFYRMEKQYEKYINDVKYDIAHPEFIGVWQTDENYQDRDELIKQNEIPASAPQNSREEETHNRSR